MNAGTIALAIGSLAAAACMWHPAFRSLDATGFGDWQYFHHMWEAGYVAVVRHDEWPLWDPYHCGGITIFGNPQSQHLSPLYLVSFLTGPTLATKIFVLLHAAAGFFGMFVFARRELGQGPTGAALASVAWAGSGFFAWHGAVGHSAFMPFYLTPLLLLAWRAAARDVRHAVTVAGLLALVLLEGGVYPFPFLTLLLAFDAAYRLVTTKVRSQIVVAGLIAAILTLLLGAVRLVPILDELDRSPRHVASVDGVGPDEALAMLTAREPWPEDAAAHAFEWPEYAAFVGWGVFLLGLAGAGLAAAQRRLWLLAGLAVFGALMLGEHGPPSPWHWLHAIPPYDSLRVPSRFAVFFTFFLALGAGSAVDALGRVLAGARPAAALRLDAIVPGLVVLALAVDLALVNLPVIDRWRGPPIATAPVAPRHHLSPQPYGRFMASFPRLGVGSPDCYEAMAFRPSRGLWRGDLPQARPVKREGASGVVSRWGRTTSRAWAEVRLDTAGPVLFNQNFAPGWRSSVGEAVADRHGRLQVVGLPAGVHRIELAYHPPTLWPSVALSALGGLLALGVLGWTHRRRSAGPAGDDLTDS